MVMCWKVRDPKGVEVEVGRTFPPEVAASLHKRGFREVSLGGDKWVKFTVKEKEDYCETVDIDVSDL